MIKATFKKSPDIHPLHHVRAIDGDTLEATIALPFDVNITKRIRLKGWWADELEGTYALAGQQAQLRVQQFIEGKVLWLHAPSCRLDLHGRVVGHLMHEGRILSGREVLGNLQLTEQEHKARRDAHKAQQRMRHTGVGDNHPSACDGSL